MEQKFIEKCNHDELDYVIKDYWQDVWNYSFIIRKIHTYQMTSHKMYLLRFLNIGIRFERSHLLKRGY